MRRGAYSARRLSHWELATEPRIARRGRKSLSRVRLASGARKSCYGEANHHRDHRDQRTDGKQFDGDGGFGRNKDGESWASHDPNGPVVRMCIVDVDVDADADADVDVALRVRQRIELDRAGRADARSRSRLWLWFWSLKPRGRDSPRRGGQNGDQRRDDGQVTVEVRRLQEQRILPNED
ncbi:hypothetical protein ColTof4_03241 [Colletotrichum tofieldiae]|nr:hypothetical protein ColTof3_13343 [Colletotrichum tofieldiae]GKT70818.1 hypothetical protein ColTof4_03241 [Colletotrichum tofieldiae]